MFSEELLPVYEGSPGMVSIQISMVGFVESRSFGVTELFGMSPNLGIVVIESSKGFVFGFGGHGIKE